MSAAPEETIMMHHEGDSEYESQQYCTTVIVSSLFKRPRIEGTIDWDSLSLQQESLRYALRTIQRELFVPSKFQHLVYQPVSIPLGFNRQLESAYDIARLLDIAELLPNEKLLEVGTGSGYQTALLSIIFPAAFVSVESNDIFFEDATDLLQITLGLRNAIILHENDTRWRDSEDVFDVILYSHITPQVPTEILSRLAVHGRLLAPTAHPWTGKRSILRITKTPTCFVQEQL